MNNLERLKSMTQVVADTGDHDAIIQYQPQDATTNPSLLLKAADLPRYLPLLKEAQRWGHGQGGSPASRAAAAGDYPAGCDRLTISPYLVQALAEDETRLEGILEPGRAADVAEKIMMLRRKSALMKKPFAG